MPQAFGLCPDQRFAQQPVQAFSSTALVAQDVVLTEGHCFKAGNNPRGVPLDEILVVFGFQILPSGKPRLRIAGRDVYAATELIKRVETGGSQPDWALLRLDRPVVRRTPVPLAPESILVAGLPVFVIGHPSGLPLKFAKGATITTLQDRYLFANLATFSCNSGSPVFDTRGNRVAGVLDEGAADYVARGSCKVVNLLPQFPGKEGVTRVGVFHDEIGRLPCTTRAARAIGLGYRHGSRSALVGKGRGPVMCSLDQRRMGTAGGSVPAPRGDPADVDDPHCLARCRPLVPPMTVPVVVTALLAGVAAHLTWEVWARALTPLWLGGPLEPAALVRMVFDLDSRFLAELIHLAVGFLFYPLGYLFLARPIARRLTPGLPWWLVGLGFGVGLWVFALYVMASLVAGMPPFLGFNKLTWFSLGGHLLYGLVTAAVVRWREGDPIAANTAA